MSLLNWLSKKFGTKKEEKEVKSKEIIKFTLIVYPDKSLDLDCKWNIGEEFVFAELVYLLCNGVYLEAILKSLQSKCVDTPLESSFNKVLEAIKEIHELEESVEQMEEESTCIEPTDVFGKMDKGEES